MRNVIIILILILPIGLLAQHFHIGSRIGVGTSRIEVVPTSFEFSNTENETDYINGIKEQKLNITPSYVSLTYQGKNRWATYLDLKTQWHSIIYDLSVEPADYYAELYPFELQINLGYFSAEGGVMFDLAPRKYIVPYLYAGMGSSRLLTLTERIPGSSGEKFTQMDGRQVRNTIIYNYLNRFNNQITTVHTGVGLRYYNMYISLGFEQTVSDFDAIGSYTNRQLFTLSFGLNLLSLELTRNQAND